MAAIQFAESEGAVVTWDDVIDGRQFDVTVRFKYGLHTYLTVIECKEYASKVSVEKVDALVTKARSVNANKAILVSTRGFQSGCFPVAERNGIELLVVTETSAATPTDLAASIVPTLNIFDVAFTRANGAGDLVFEDWGGRQAYLMAKSTLRSESWTGSPDELIDRWTRSRPDVRPGAGNSFELELPAGAVLEMPFEEPVGVARMRFKGALIHLRKAAAPMPDHHIQQGLRAVVEVRDGQGKLVHAARLKDIPLGFDAALTPGRFYELPSLCNRYYCEGISAGLVTWILVESYQHGTLIQGQFLQKLKFSRYYVPVDDDGLTRRLKGMLDVYRSRPWESGRSRRTRTPADLGLGRQAEPTSDKT